MVNEKNGNGQTLKKTKQPIPIDLRQNTDIFTQSNNNQKFMKKQFEMMQIIKNKDVWTHNYQTGTKYELYRVALQKTPFDGLKFKDVTMILYQKLQLFLIALEVRIAGQTKVFVNPSEYIFDSCDHYGYVISNCQPEFD